MLVTAPVAFQSGSASTTMSTFWSSLMLTTSVSPNFKSMCNGVRSINPTFAPADACPVTAFTLLTVPSKGAINVVFSSRSSACW